MAPTSSSARKSSSRTTTTTTTTHQALPKIHTTKGSTSTIAKAPATSSYSHHPHHHHLHHHDHHDHHDHDHHGFIRKHPIVRVVRVFAPKIVTANADNFRAIVQRLTGNLDSPLHTICAPPPSSSSSSSSSPHLSVQSSSSFPNMSPFSSPNSIPTPLLSPHSSSSSIASSVPMSSSTSSPTNLAICVPNSHHPPSSSSQNHGPNISSPESLHDRASPFSNLLQFSDLQAPYIPKDSESSSSSESTNSFPLDIIDNNCFPTISSDTIEYDSFETPALPQGTPNHVIHTYNEFYRLYTSSYPPQCNVNRRLHVEEDEDETSLFNEFDTMLSSIKLPNF